MRRANRTLSNLSARADSFALEVAGLRRERRLLRKAVKSWTRRRRKLLLRKRIYDAAREAGEN